MKNSIKIIAALCASAALASSVCAGDVIIFKKNTNTSSVPEKTVEAVEAVSEDESYIFVNGSWYKKVDDKEAPISSKTNGKFIITDGKVLKTASEQGDIFKDGTVFVEADKSTAASVYKNSIMKGGKYYCAKDAKVLLDEYFENNCYSIKLVEGEESGFTAGAYVLSSDPSIVSYDKATGKIKANSYGTCELYLYTAGGIPFFKVKVTVIRDMLRTGAKDSLVLDSEKWNIGVDGISYISVSSLSGKKYEDIAFKILNDNGSAVVGAANGKVTGLADGAVVVHAYSKSNPDICGDALIYVGEYLDAIRYGGWNLCNGGISVNNWYNGYFTNPCAVEGYIRSARGIMIPVVKEIEAIKNEYDGTKKDTTVIVSGTVSYADLLKELYGDKDTFADAIEKYNLFKYGKTCSDRYLDKYELDEDDIRLIEAVRLIYGD